MKIYVYKQEEEKAGNLCLWYGKSGVGKTATLLQTVEDPIAYVMFEGRSLNSTLQAINRPGLRIKVFQYADWDDLLEVVYNPDNFLKCKSIIKDSMTHLMNVLLPDEILEENFEARDRKKGDETMKDLTTRVKGTPEMYGALSKQMSRLMNASQQLCLAGHDVHWTARDMDNPKWNTELTCGPALAGKEFPRDMKGFFDFIGMVESRYDDSGNIVYPPVVSCDDAGAYLSKWTGVKPLSGVIRKPFNVQAMLATAHGRSMKGGTAASANSTTL